jgi:hypothetical protein
LLFLSGCHYREGVSVEVLQEGKIAFDRIALVPFIRMSPEDASVRAVRCPLCGSILRTEKCPRDMEKVIEDIFSNDLKNRKKCHLVPPEVTGPVFDRISLDSKKAALPDVLKAVGAELGAEGIIVAYVTRYNERKGVAYSVERPASVAFEIHLVRVSDGVTVWKGLFDKTQQSLTENVFQMVTFFKGHARWLTAKELVMENMDALMEDFPGGNK